MNEMRKTTDPLKTRNPEWGFYGTMRINRYDDPDAAWKETIEALTDLHGRFRFEPETARDLLDATWGRHLADEMVGMRPADCLRDLSNDRRWMIKTVALARAIVASRADTGE
jgi:hypothetical protein